ncbi:MAG TPA: helix-turn-helix domain-containing protein [Magnetospirillum sp.]|nr:helix-turn-helix domain-containing protein [Magnetospirillum sp.]
MSTAKKMLKRVIVPAVPADFVPRSTSPSSPPQDGVLLTPPEVAARLQVSVKSLENWRRTGAGPRFIRLGRCCVRYAREDVEDFIRARTARNTAER